MKFIYKVASGVLNNYNQEYWFTNSYFTSQKKAELEIKQILEINQAEAIDITTEPNHTGFNGKELSRTYYIGEQGRYKALIILTKVEIR
jgi:hypothetical protein